MKRDRFLQVRFHFVKRSALSNNRQLKTFGDVIFLALRDTELNNSIHGAIVPGSIKKMQADVDGANRH
jgi:hypothetical protein